MEGTKLIVLVLILTGSLKIHAVGFSLPQQWKNFKYGDQANPLYTKDQTSELLNLCVTHSGKDAIRCSAVNPAMKCISDCSDIRLEALRFAKDEVRGVIQHTIDPLKTAILWLILAFCCAGGIYLTLKGHYQWVNLPLIGNWLMDDPTDGIKFRHYMWMRWITLGNSNIHWAQYMQQDSFVYKWSPLPKLDRPPTPKEDKLNEPGDRLPWTIDDILHEKGIPSEDVDANGTLNDGWEKAVQYSQRKSNKGSLHHLDKPGNKLKDDENQKYQEVLDEYYERIYEWSWHRYRNIPEEVKRESFGKDARDDEDDTDNVI